LQTGLLQGTADEAGEDAPGCGVAACG